VTVVLLLLDQRLLRTRVLRQGATKYIMGTSCLVIVIYRSFVTV